MGFRKWQSLFGIIKCRNNTLGVFCARGEAEGYKSHRGYYCYLILRQGTYFDCPKRSWGLLPWNKAHFYFAKCSKSIKCRMKIPIVSETRGRGGFRNFRKGAWARRLNLSYAIIILKSYKMLKTKDLYLSANFRNIIWKTPYNLIYHLICYYRIMFQLFFIINLMNHFR